MFFAENLVNVAVLACFLQNFPIDNVDLQFFHNSHARGTELHRPGEPLVPSLGEPSRARYRTSPIKTLSKNPIGKPSWGIKQKTKRAIAASPPNPS